MRYFTIFLVELCLFGLFIEAQVGLPTFNAVVQKRNTTSATLITKRVNIGGSSYTDGQGNVWEANNGCTIDDVYSVTDPIANTTDDPLYQTEGWSAAADPVSGLPSMDCSWSVPNGSYTVTLKFAEIYFAVTGGGGAGSRVFDIYLNNILVSSAYDTLNHIGALTADDASFPNVQVTNGVLSVHMVATGPNVDNPHLNAIQMAQTSSTGGGGVTGTQLTSIIGGSPGGDCQGGIDVTAAVNSAFSAVANGSTIVFDCVANISGNVLLSSKSNVTLDAASGMGFRFQGTPATATEQFKISSCNGCKVLHMTIDVNGRQSTGFTERNSDNTIFQYNTIKNPSPLSQSAAQWRSGNFNKILDNTLIGVNVELIPGTNRVNNTCTDCGFVTRGFHVGEGSERENNAEIARNRTTSSGHTYIVLTGTNGYIHDNYGSGLVFPGVKLSGNQDYGAGTTIVENNEFHGSTAGYTESGGSPPAVGGGVQLGNVGTSTGQETVIVRNNTFDGGSYAFEFVGVLGAVDAHHNYLLNNWEDCALLAGHTNTGAINIHHNWCGTTRGPYPGRSWLESHGLQILVDTGATYSNITFANNWLSLANENGIKIGTYVSGATVSGVSITGNSFVGNHQYGILVEKSAGTISSVSQSGNCFSGNTSGAWSEVGTSFFGSAPAQSGSCSNPTGLTPPSTATTINIFSTATGNGTTDDLAAIQAAIDASPTDAIINFGTGFTYKLSSNLVLKPSRTYKGASTLILSSTATLGSAVAKLLYGASDNVTIQDLTFDANSRGGSLLIGVDGGSTTPAQNITITAATFKNNRSGGGLSEAGIYNSVGLVNSSISGSSFIDCNTGVYAVSPQTLSITGNTFTRPRNNAISLVSSSGTQSGIVITNNTGTGLKRMGVEIFGGSAIGPLVSGNSFTSWDSVHETDPYGISIVSGINAQVTSNILTGSTDGYCVEIGGSAFTVKDNTCTNFLYGAVIQGQQDAVVDHNTFVNTGDSAVYFSNAGANPRAIVKNNTITNARYFGIGMNINDYSGSQITGNTINRAGGAWTGDATAEYFGVKLDDGNTGTITFSNNTIAQTATVPPSGWRYEAVGAFGLLRSSTFSGNQLTSSSTAAFGRGLFLNSTGFIDGSVWTNNHFVKLINVSNGNTAGVGTKTNNTTCNVTNTDANIVTGVSCP